MRRSNPARESLYESPAYAVLLGRIGTNLRRLREAKGWTQEECAFRCGDMAAPLLRRIELAATNVTALTLARLAEGLGVDPSELLVPVTASSRRGPGRPRGAGRERVSETSPSGDLSTPGTVTPEAPGTDEPDAPAPEGSES